jgi:CRP-like cAMP-binding protein
VRATGPVETLRISKDHFLRMLREFPEMTVEIVRVLAMRLSSTTAELAEARSNPH